jgi:hypothetical protein
MLEQRPARYGSRMTTSEWAASYAEELLSPLGDQWLHVQGVARQAQGVARSSRAANETCCSPPPTCMTSATPLPW